MKKLFSFAICAMAVLAMMFAMDSCKKDDQNVKSNNSGSEVSHFDPSHITDMKAYLKDFKQRMNTSKDGETLTLEEAAWHLSCLANIDFCRINVEYNDFLFDTIGMQVNVTDGAMLMTDFCRAYEQMCLEIQQFKKGFNHLDQNMYFIKVSIDDKGKAKIALMTSYIRDSKDLYNHQWYFEDVWDAVDACSKNFSDDSTYIWNTTAARELQRVLNLFEHHENCNTPYGPMVCYIPTRDHDFNYTNTYDPYGSENSYINESRVFAKRYHYPYPDYTFEGLEMCYCLDSYLGLGYDYINDGLYLHEFPVNWTVTPVNLYESPYYYIYHNLHVEYGRSYDVN